MDSPRLVLFTNDREEAALAMRHGIGSCLVDLESIGKASRQRGFDTEIRPGTPGDIAAIATLPGADVWCRLNRFGDYTASEIEVALTSGAKTLLLPMVTTKAEVIEFERMVNGRCRTGVLVETIEAVELAPQLRDSSLDLVYFGLNDYAIARGGGSIFRALADGTVERVRQALPHIQFGFAGLTAVEHGAPIPCAYLLAEMNRMRCAFAFLRRSYRRDAERIPAAEIVIGIRNRWARYEGRTSTERENDRRRLVEFVNDAEHYQELSKSAF